MSYTLDTKQAIAADSIASSIRETGKYVGVITRAEAITSTRGTKGLGLSFKSDDGSTADYLDLYTHKADGEALSSLKTVNAILACCKLRSINEGPIQFEKWDKFTKQRTKVSGKGYPELMGKRIGFLLRKEIETDDNGQDRDRVAIFAVFQHDTELTATEEKAEELARNIHATREKAAPTFNDAIQTTLARLGMPEARFVVQLTPAPALTPTGDDEIDFLFTANGNFAPQKVERIASGGEISRVMLALKALLAHRMELPTIIFDEIDTGVSGRIADAMGEIIADLSQTMQVVDITHLPQVASKGDTHFVVYKDAEGSHIRRLDPEERITEIAKMLSGSQITEAALAQARILLDK